MFVLINGAFGIGKPTVAESSGLSCLGRSSSIPSGSVSPLDACLAVRFLTSKTSIRGVALRCSVRDASSRFGARLSFPWLSPIAHTSMRSDRALPDPVGRCFTFVSRLRLTVVRERLKARGEPLDDPAWSWVHRRAAECRVAHRSPAFATHMPTDKRSPASIAAVIAALVQ
jgi:hypothetical protein